MSTPAFRFLCPLSIHVDRRCDYNLLRVKCCVQLNTSTEVLRSIINAWHIRYTTPFLSQSIVQDDERSSKPAQGSTMYKISRRMEVCVAMIGAVGARARVL